MNHQACAINATKQLVKVHKIQSHLIYGSHWKISINFNAYLTIFSPPSVHSMNLGNSHHFSTETHGNAICPSESEKKVWEPKGELIRLSDVISQDQRNDKIDLSSSTKIHFLDSQPPNYLKVQASALGKNLCFVSVNPLLSMQRHLGLF